MSKHTPAPWIADDTVHGPGKGIVHIRSTEPFPQEICTVWRASLNDPSQFEANARLIAAAPDLLDACDFALSILEALGNGKGDAANACRAAIAKAEGGAQ